MNRRQLAKGVAAGLATSLTPANAGRLPPPGNEVSRSDGNPVHPGVWRARLGTPEPHTPVSPRPFLRP